MTSPLRNDKPEPLPAEPGADQCPAVYKGEQCRMAVHHRENSTVGVEWVGDRDDIARAKRDMSPHLAIVDGETVMW